MEITKNITTVNRTVNSSRNIKYLVIHWVGAVSSAKNNALYFKSVNRSASAHYFVDNSSIYQVVEEKDVAWHCGTSGTYYHSECRNNNSIGVEMCLDKANHISDATIERTSLLVQLLMKKYNIPEKNVIRHYDVTHKLCPAIYVDETKWKELKKKLCGTSVSASSTTTATTKQSTTFKDYKVKITASELNVRKGPGTNFGIATKVRKGEVYTIVGEEKNGSTVWGKLKSGTGYISLGYTQKC